MFLSTTVDDAATRTGPLVFPRARKWRKFGCPHFWRELAQWPSCSVVLCEGSGKKVSRCSSTKIFLPELRPRTFSAADFAGCERAALGNFKLPRAGVGSQSWCEDSLSRNVFEARNLVEAINNYKDAQGDFCLLRSCACWSKTRARKWRKLATLRQRDNHLEAVHFPIAHRTLFQTPEDPLLITLAIYPTIRSGVRDTESLQFGCWPDREPSPSPCASRSQGCSWLLSVPSFCVKSFRTASASSAHASPQRVSRRSVSLWTVSIHPVPLDHMLMS